MSQFTFSFQRMFLLSTCLGHLMVLWVRFVLRRWMVCEHGASPYDNMSFFKSKSVRDIRGINHEI